MLSVETLDEIHDVMNRQLAEHDVALDAIYFCPEAPSSSDRTAIDHPDRKPAPGMLLKAAADLDLDLAASWMIGDMISDGLAGQHAGCRGSILVRTGKEPPDEEGHGFDVRDDLTSAVELILNNRSLPASGA